MCEDVNKHGQAIFVVEELTFTYFYGTAWHGDAARSTPYPPQYSELDAILRGWESIVVDTGCYIREWPLSDTEFVAAILDQSEHLISCIYVKGHA